MPIVFKVRDKDNLQYTTRKPRFKLVRRIGELYEFEGRHVELFMIKVLAEAIDRAPDYLRDLEKRGEFPKPLFLLPGNRKKWRVYSAEQIINLHRIMWHRYLARKNHMFNRDSFLDDVNAVYYKPGVLVGEDGEMLDNPIEEPEKGDKSFIITDGEW